MLTATPVIEDIIEEKIKEPEEVAPAPIENDFEIKLKKKPEPKEIEQPFDNLASGNSWVHWLGSLMMLRHFGLI